MRNRRDHLPGRDPRDRARHDADAPVDEAPRARLDRVRALRGRTTTSWSCATSSPTRTTPRDFEFSDRLDRNQDQVDPPPEGDGRRHPRRRGGDRVRLPRRLHASERRPQGARRPHRGRPGRRGALARPLARDRQGPRRRRGRSPSSTTSTASRGTHAIGHVRMATESDVDISGAHPYWAYPFSDVAVVHNGQLTNYFQWKRRLERSGHRFQSECDSEIIAVYLAEKMSEGASLEDAMRESLEELDGVFTYIASPPTRSASQGRDGREAARALRSRTTSSRSPPRRSRSARSSTTRSTPTTRTRGRCWCGSGRRIQDHVRRARARRAVRRQRRASPRSTDGRADLRRRTT